MEAAITTTLKIGVLGPLEVRQEGVPLPIAGQKQCALLALLCSEVGQVVSADRIIDELWGNDVPADPPNALQHHASRLRKALGDRLVRRSSGYLLDVPPDHVDACRLESLTEEGRAALRRGDAQAAASILDEAMALWRGEPYVEFAEQGWARIEAARLERVRLDGLEDRFDASLAAGRHLEVIGEIEAACHQHPFRERLWGQLMVALYRCGRQTDALQAYRDAKELLQAEQGLDPSPHLQQLEAAILNQDPALSQVPAVDVDSSLAPSEAAPQQGGLVSPLTSFIGRHEQVFEIARLIGEYRLVTLTGAPGVGKTRLALEVGRGAVHEYPDGVWFVELAAVADPQSVAAYVAAALGVRVQDRPSHASSEDSRLRDAAVVSLLAHLRGRDTLIVLDNCEHVLPQVADLVASLLRHCERSTVLATSREALALAGEVQWPVPTLSLPGEQPVDPRELVGSEAVRLFEDRARRVRPSFRITSSNGNTVARICRHLDGLPLAIELAAARVNALPLTHIEEELADRFTFLISKTRGIPARQQTLQATVDWSYALLRVNERETFLSVSVFVGGFSLRAAQWIGERMGIAPEDTRDLLTSLVEKSLLVPAAVDNGDARYDMLDTLRAYGLARLIDAGRLAQVRYHHAEYFTELAEAAEQQLYGPEHVAGSSRLTADLDNIHEAMRHAVSDGHHTLTLRLAAALGWYCRMTMRHPQGRAWLETALAGAPDSAEVLTRSRAWTSLGNLAANQLDLGPAIDAGERGLQLALDSGDTWQIAFASASLAAMLRDARISERVPALLAAARTGFDAVDEPRGDWGMAGCELIAAIAAVDAGDVDAVETAQMELARRARRLGQAPWEAWARLLSGWLEEQRGNAAAAVSAYGAVLPVVGHGASGHFAAFVLTLLGRAAMLAGDLQRATAAAKEAVHAVDPATEPWFAAFAHYGLARTLHLSGDVQGAQHLYRLAADESPTAGSGFSLDLTFTALAGSPAAGALVELGALELQAGDTESAQRLQREGLERAYEEHDATTMAMAIEGLAVVADCGLDGEESALLSRTAESLRRREVSTQQALATAQGALKVSGPRRGSSYAHTGPRR